MDIVKQIIDQRVNKIVETNPDLFIEYRNDPERQRSQAFLLLGVASYLSIDISEAVQYLTEGSSDGGFDAAYIDPQGEGRLDVVLFQSKYVRNLDGDNNFPANSVEKAVSTVKCVFDPSRRMQLNEKSRKKVEEIQSFILDGNVPYVTFVMLNNGLKWNQDGQNHIDNVFRGQKQVEFLHFNHKNIINIGGTGDIDSSIQFKGTSIKEDFNYRSVMIGKVLIAEISKLMEEYGDRLLEKNIRKYLGNNSVNNAIRDTLLDEERKQNFFFYNNGITMVCDKFDYNAIQSENWSVRIKKLQIINGGQTCKTIWQTVKDNPEKDFSDVTVLLRLYAIGDDEDVIRGVTVATNTQNPVNLRDLMANDPKQLLLEQNARELGYTYKRKRDDQANTNTIPSSVAAEAVFAVWREKPYLIQYRKNQLFDEHYEEIFRNLNAPQMIIAVLIFRYCDNLRKKSSDAPGVSAQRAYSQYLLSMLIGKRILSECGITLDGLEHNTFERVRRYFEDQKDDLYSKAEAEVIKCLKDHLQEPLSEVDGRTVAALFRRFEFTKRFGLRETLG